MCIIIFQPGITIHHFILRYRSINYLCNQRHIKDSSIIREIPMYHHLTLNRMCSTEEILLEIEEILVEILLQLLLRIRALYRHQLDSSSLIIFITQNYKSRDHWVESIGVKFVKNIYRKKEMECDRDKNGIKRCIKRCSVGVKRCSLWYSVGVWVFYARVNSICVFSWVVLSDSVTVVCKLYCVF